MDVQTGNEVADDSGHENHGSGGSAISKLSKFSRGRFFNGRSGKITVPNAASLNFKNSSFTVAGWAKILDHTYPLTTFAVRKALAAILAQAVLDGFPDGRQDMVTKLRLCAYASGISKTERFLE